MIALYIARHGQTDANVENRYPGRRETLLTVRGEMQAAAMGECLRRVLGPAPALKCVASPLGRAQHTMRIIRRTLGLPAEGFATDPRLLDIDHGAWTGLTPEEVRERFPENFAHRQSDEWNVPMQGGESYADLAARVGRFLADLAADTLTVSHGATSQLLRGLSVGMDPARMVELPETQGVVFRVRDRTLAQLDP